MPEEPRPLLMVSNSEIGSFKQCRRKWNFSSFNRRNLIPKVPNLKFWIGTGGHHALERWHGYGEDPISTFREWARQEIIRITNEAGGQSKVGPGLFDSLQEMIDLGVKILQHYVSHAEKNILPLYTFIATEYEFSVPIPGLMIDLLDPQGKPFDWVIDTWGVDWFENDQFQTLYVKRNLYYHYEDEHKVICRIPPLYVGRLDGLVQDKHGTVFVVDHKFMASLVDPEMLTLDEQTSKYVWAANVAIEHGWWPEVPQGTLVGGALYNVVRKKAPSIPAHNKDGKTSVAKNIDTTESVFKATLVARGQDPMDYVDMLLYLRAKNGWDGKQSKFFQLLPVERGERELELIGEKLTWEYQDMANIATVTKDVMHPALYPNPTMDCRWKCSFKHLCYVANFGGDVEGMIADTMVHQKRTDLYASQLEEPPE